MYRTFRTLRTLQDRCTLLFLSLCLYADAIRSLRDVSGINSYLSRPDIQAPQWQVTVYDKTRIAPGYWFVAPFENIGQSEAGDSWIGPHIYDAHGDLVWSGSKLFGAWNTYDFRISNIMGEDRMTLVNGRDGTAVTMGNDYRIEHSWHMGTTGINLNVHELNFVDNGTRALIAIETHHKATSAQSNAVGWTAGNCDVIFQGFQEMDVATWTPVFTWTSTDHVGLEESSYLEGSLSSRCNGSWGWDYFHVNSIDKSIDGDYFVSARHTDTIYKVSGRNGSVIWRLGGLHSDFQMNDLQFSRQHDIRYRGQNETHTFLSFLDNAKGMDKNKPTYKYSRGVLVALQTHTKPMVATVLQYIDHPEGVGQYAFRRGNLQQLPNGNTWMDWSEQALQSEHAPDGTILMQARLSSEWLGTYRSYKFPFVGAPSEPIAVHTQAYSAADNATTRTLVHTSWNGATEVASWHLYKTTHTGDPRAHGARQPRGGVATPPASAGNASYVVVDAVNARGDVLASSDVFKTIPPTEMGAAVADEVLWLQEMARVEAEPLSPQAQLAMDEAAADLPAPGLVPALAGNPVGMFFVGFAVSVAALSLAWRFRARRDAALADDDNSSDDLEAVAAPAYRSSRTASGGHHARRDSADTATTEILVYRDK